MVLNWKYYAKLVGAVVLASFVFWVPAYAQIGVPRFEAGCLLMLIKDEAIKTQLEEGKVKPAAFVQVFLNNPLENPDQPAIIGDFAYANGEIRFTPLISLQKGKSYYVQDQEKKIHPVTIPQGTFIQPRVLAVYPSADTLPANLLKFYLHFNMPMSAGKAYEHVKVVRGKNDTLVFPFVRLEPELWNREKTRLTLWLDPGRVKRDLNPNRELGAPLQFGANYQLIVASIWEDQQGHALGETFIKNFYVGEDDRKKPDVAKWKVTAPTAGSKTPLRIAFGEPMDHALAGRVVEVLNAQKGICAGHISFSDKEKVLLFVPAQAWQAGVYKIRIGAELEDLAGNNLNRLFDVDLQKEAAQVANETFYWLSFQVKK